MCHRTDVYQHLGASVQIRTTSGVRFSATLEGLDGPAVLIAPGSVRPATAEHALPQGRCGAALTIDQIASITPARD